jgi:putative tryptophan/tyrosine transport system substrate-binding protein
LVAQRLLGSLAPARSNLAKYGASAFLSQSRRRIRKGSDPCKPCYRACKTWAGSLAQTCKSTFRYGDGNRERIAAVAKELVAAQPEVLEVETTPGTAAVLKETHTIPIVFTSVSDPVGAGFVQSLSHPGGDTTGFINNESSIGGKWLQLLKEVMPQVTRATVLFNLAAAPQADYHRRSIEAAAPPLAITTRMALVSDMVAMEKEIVASAQDPRAGPIIGPDAFTFVHRFQIVALVNGANARRLSAHPVYRRRRAAFVW